MVQLACSLLEGFESGTHKGLDREQSRAVPRDRIRTRDHEEVWKAGDHASTVCGRATLFNEMLDKILAALATNC